MSDLKLLWGNGKKKTFTGFSKFHRRSHSIKNSVLNASTGKFFIYHGTNSEQDFSILATFKSQTLQLDIS